MPRKKREILVAGNWKMYKTIFEASKFVETLASFSLPSQVKVYLAIPFTAIHPTVQRIKTLNAPFQIGAQNMNDATEGAFTGEIAGKMLLEAGATFTILGHSERRHLFHETNAFVNRKIKRALLDHLEPILCIGETDEERREGRTEGVLETQLLESLEGVEDITSLTLAYEPVWAIGTGKVASAEDAERAHLFCRQLMEKKWGKKMAKGVKILYGGSVKSENAPSLISQPNIDGFLVGGASLSPQSFQEIIQLCRK